MMVNKCRIMMRTTGLVPLTTRVLVTRRERINVGGNRIVLPLTKGGREL